MFCTGCGTPIQPHDHFCHHCGKQMQPVDMGQPPHRRKTAPWVILTGAFFLFLTFYFTWSMVSYSNLEGPVRAQLRAIRTGKIPEAYYEYTSKKFQSATSLDQFKAFVNSHTVLIKNSDATFQSPEIEEDIGLLKGILYSSTGDQAPIQYLLERQEDEWKILNMDLSAVSATDSFDPKNRSEADNALFMPISEQLVDLKEGKKQEAYKDVSQGFKNATSFDQFQTFVDRFPVLNSHTGHAFKERVIEGDRAAVRVDLMKGKEVIPVEYHLVKEDGNWKIWSLQVLTPKMETPNVNLMLAPVQEQLKALQENEVEEAYNQYVSEEFKKITPLSTFKAFVERFKILQDYTKIDYKQPRIEETGGKVLVVLHNKEGGTATLEYTLGVEGGEWKIWGFRLTKQPTIDASDKDNIKEFNSDSLAEVAKAQLAAIRSGDLEKAYNEYASDEFKKATSLEVFKQFVNRYNIFNDYRSVSFSNLMLNNNVATLKGIFVGADGVDVPVEYDFILDENDQWKVLRIQFLKEGEASSSSALSYFPKIVVGTEVDAQGAVIDETKIIRDRTKSVYANIYVNGQKGDNITVVFKHVDSGSAIKPVVSSPMPQDGVFRTSFSFNPPPKGWPAGEYALEVTSSTGQSDVFKFEIE